MNDKHRDDAREDALTLELLEAIEQRSDVTQRHLASRMGIALGLANACLKRCVRKGLVKIQQAPANRYLYYLTPQGFSEKSRLTAEYLSISFQFYRRASHSCSESLAQCRAAGVGRLGLFGASELAEVAALKALDSGPDVVCLCEPSGDVQHFLKLAVVTSIDAAPAVDAWLLTALDDVSAKREYLAAAADGLPVFVPSILGLVQPPLHNSANGEAATRSVGSKYQTAEK